jgi:precorrin-6B methylase 2
MTDRAAARSFINWLQRDEGHIVVGIAYTDAGNVIKDNSNKFGYSNWIIIRNKCTDPSENQGTPTRMLFTGSSGAETTFAQEWAAQPVGSQKGAVLNLNRQVQLTLRIITREFDSASNVRPDNV